MCIVARCVQREGQGKGPLVRVVQVSARALYVQKTSYCFNQVVAREVFPPNTSGEILEVSKRYYRLARPNRLC